MRKILFIVFTIMFVVSMAGVSFAKKEFGETRKERPVVNVSIGKVVSVDSFKNEVVVEDKKTGQAKTFVADEKTIRVLSAGMKVKVVANRGNNFAQRIVVLRAR